MDIIRCLPRNAELQLRCMSGFRKQPCQNHWREKRDIIVQHWVLRCTFLQLVFRSFYHNILALNLAQLVKYSAFQSLLYLFIISLHWYFRSVLQCQRTKQFCIKFSACFSFFKGKEQPFINIKTCLWVSAQNGAHQNTGNSLTNPWMSHDVEIWSYAQSFVPCHCIRQRGERPDWHPWRCKLRDSAVGFTPQLTGCHFFFFNLTVERKKARWRAA